MEVLGLLRRGIGTVSELAKRLQLTDNAVRSHLLSLEKDGAVRRRGLKRGVSRPHVIYELTGATQDLFPHAYDASLIALLGAMKRRFPPVTVSELLHLAGARLARRFQKGGRGKSITQRAQDAARILNRLGGSARLFREGRELTIRSSACPLSAVVVEHPETCALVEKLLSRVCGTAVKETCARGETPRCIFRLRK